MSGSSSWMHCAPQGVKEFDGDDDDDDDDTEITFTARSELGLLQTLR